MTDKEMTNEELLEVFFNTINHLCPKFLRRLRKIPDPRNPKMIIYTKEVLLLEVMFMFLFKLGSRRDINFKLNKGKFKENLLEWLSLGGEDKVELERLPDEDTPPYLLSRLDPQHLRNFATGLVRDLIRMRALEKFRLFDRYYMIAIDATWTLRFGNKKHCDHCLRMKKGEDEEGNPKYIYYHAVLEAKLVCANGFAFSIATEFIENIDIDESKGFEEQKQDCELKAYYRIAPKIKRRFPQLNICLLFDGLYDAKPVFDICEKNHWKYIITFKEGSMPATYKEFKALKKAAPEDCHHWEKGEVSQNYYWVNGIEYYKHKLNVLECCETKKDEKETRFLWVSNFVINSDSFKEIREFANEGGRCRWKIENEGFNAQKNGGYELEHAYCLDPTAIKNFYLLLQIAHIINQLVEKGSLLKDKLLKTFGSVKNFTAALLNAFTSELFHFNSAFLNRRIQIRFSYDSS